MVRILFVTFSGYPYTISSFFPDNSLAGMAGQLLRAGHQPRILDLNRPAVISKLIPPNLAAEIETLLPSILGLVPLAGDRERLLRIEEQVRGQMAPLEQALWEELHQEIQTFQPHLTGFKLWMGDGFHPSLRLAMRLRRAAPGMVIVAGGPQTLQFGEWIYRFPAAGAFDALVTGDFDHAIIALAEAAEAGTPLARVPNLLLRDGQARTPAAPVDDLDSLAPATYSADVYPAIAAGEKLLVISVDDSRGCPNGCHFCCHTALSGKRRRTRDPGLFAETLADLHQRHGFRLFRFAGSNTPWAFIEQVSEELRQRRLPLTWSAFTQPAAGSPDVYARVRDAGCFGFFCGVETLDQPLRETVLGKRGDVEGMLRELGLALDAGLFVVSSIIHPLPGETPASAARTRDGMIALHAPQRGSVVVNPPALFPRSRWLEQPAQFGFGLPDRDAYLLENIDYQIKTLFPLSMWRELPYTVDGRPMGEVVLRTEEFARQLAAAGVITQLQDDAAMTGAAAGLSPLEFRRQVTRALVCADQAWVEQLIGTVNRCPDLAAAAASPLAEPS